MGRALALHTNDSGFIHSIPCGPLNTKLITEPGVNCEYCQVWLKNSNNNKKIPTNINNSLKQSIGAIGSLVEQPLIHRDLVLFNFCITSMFSSFLPWFSSPHTHIYTSTHATQAHKQTCVQWLLLKLASWQQEPEGPHKQLKLEPFGDLVKEGSWLLRSALLHESLILTTLLSNSEELASALVHIGGRFLPSRHLPFAQGDADQVSVERNTGLVAQRTPEQVGSYHLFWWSRRLREKTQDWDKEMTQKIFQEMGPGSQDTVLLALDMMTHEEFELLNSHQSSFLWGCSLPRAYPPSRQLSPPGLPRSPQTTGLQDRHSGVWVFILGWIH